MKNAWDEWSVGARALLEEFDIDVHYTKADLAKADKGDIHNLAFALNGVVR